MSGEREARPVGMRVMHIITRMILGGAQENTLLTVEGLRARGHEVVLVTGPTIGPEGDLLRRAQERGVATVVVGSMRRAINPVRDALAFVKLIGIIRRFKPDVVHTHSSKAGILGRLAARVCRVPMVVHTVHGLAFHRYQCAPVNWMYIALERWCARYTTKIICVADAMTEEAVAARVAKREKFVTVYSGMEVGPFLEASKHREQVRKELGIGPDELVVGKVARLSDLKGHRYLFEAIPEVLERFPRTRFVMVGDGWLTEELKRRAQEMGITERVIFTGLVSPARISELLGGMDVVVHTSLREGLARVLPQALIAGVPVVSYDVDGAREVVIDGETGYLVKPKAVGELAEAMCKLLESPELREKMGRAGRGLCSERFRTEKMVEDIARVYNLSSTR